MRDDRVTPILHGAAVRSLALSSVFALLLLGACASEDSIAPDPGTSKVANLDPAVFEAGRPAPVPAARDVPVSRDIPVTHLGRTVLPDAELVILARTERLTPAQAGIEIARVEPLRTLHGAAPTDESTLTVICGEPGILPGPGGQALLILRRRPRSPNHETVQVVPVSGKGGAERLEAFELYLDVEGLPDEAERVERLLDYLRDALRDPRRWTRANAALEYASLAAARPDDLGGADIAPLRSAILSARNPGTRNALQRALAVAERDTGARPTTARGPSRDPARADTAALAAAVEEFDATEDAAKRRDLVLDAAVDLGRRSTPLLRRALADPDARVREAGIAAAAEVGARSLTEPILGMLTGDDPLPLRRSAVRALGYLAAPSAVPTLSLMARGGGALEKDATFALARVRDEPALLALEGLRDAATDAERRRLIAFLLSDAFVEQERGLGRMRSDDPRSSR